MVEVKTNLGKGLSALLGDDMQDYAKLDQHRGVRKVPIEFLHPGRYQPRRKFDEVELEALIRSIQDKGILSPIMVRRHPDRPSEFEIIAGERRWRAAQLAQQHEVPVLVTDYDDRACLEISLIENVQRQDLTSLEEAQGYQRLMDEFGYTQEDVADAVGKSRSHVGNLLRLLNLPEEVQNALQDGALSAGHARALLKSKNAAALLTKIQAQDLSVRQVEDLVRQEHAPTPAASPAGQTPGARDAQATTSGQESPSGGAPYSSGAASTGVTTSVTTTKTTGGYAANSDSNPNLRALRQELETLLGLKVGLRVENAEGTKGAVTIHYETLEQLDDVLARLRAPMLEQELRQRAGL